MSYLERDLNVLSYLLLVNAPCPYFGSNKFWDWPSKVAIDKKIERIKAIYNKTSCFK